MFTVSIPRRDFIGFRGGMAIVVLTDGDSFQSLEGILSDLEGSARIEVCFHLKFVSIPRRDFIGFRVG